jgi:hypothetical protein
MVLRAWTTWLLLVVVDQDEITQAVVGQVVLGQALLML